MLLCIEYGILFVDTVYTKIKAYNALNAMFVDTVDTGVCGLSRKSSIPDEPVLTVELVLLRINQVWINHSFSWNDRTLN